MVRNVKIHEDLPDFLAAQLRADVRSRLGWLVSWLVEGLHFSLSNLISGSTILLPSASQDILRQPEQAVQELGVAFVHGVVVGLSRLGRVHEAGQRGSLGLVVLVKGSHQERV